MTHHDRTPANRTPADLGRMAQVFGDCEDRRAAHAHAARLRTAAILSLAALTGAALAVLALALI